VINTSEYMKLTPMEDEASPKESEKVCQDLWRRYRRGVMESEVYGI
jgi:hypothetical protein